jgi:hypothetical protein
MYNKCSYGNLGLPAIVGPYGSVKNRNLIWQIHGRPGNPGTSLAQNCDLIYRLPEGPKSATMHFFLQKIV